MTKIADLLHNSSVVSAADLLHNELVATFTRQGCAYVWDLMKPDKPSKVFKFDSQNIVNAHTLNDFDINLYPFIIAQSAEGELHVMQITTGKTQKLKFRS